MSSRPGRVGSGPHRDVLWRGIGAKEIGSRGGSQKARTISRERLYESEIAGDFSRRSNAGRTSCGGGEPGSGRPPLDRAHAPRRGHREGGPAGPRESAALLGGSFCGNPLFQRQPAEHRLPQPAHRWGQRVQRGWHLRRGLGSSRDCGVDPPRRLARMGGDPHPARRRSALRRRRRPARARQQRGREPTPRSLRREGQPRALRAGG